MKSRTLFAVVAWIWFCTLTPGPHFRSWAQVAEAPLARPATARTALPYAAPALPGLGDPALPGGIGVLGGLAPALSLPALSPAALTGGLTQALPASMIPLTRSVPAGDLAARDVAELASALPPAAELAGGRQGSLSQAYGALGRRFDATRDGAPELPEEVSAAAGASEQAASALSPLSTIHPRVVFLQDIFDKPASETTVQYVEKLAEAGAHIVFMTWRPHKGAGSAEEILLGRLKNRRTNPILVVSYNGGRIALHGKAENPKPVIEDIPGFPAQDLESFKGFKDAAEKGLGLAEPLQITTLPLGDSIFTYIATLPPSIADADVPAAREQLLRRYNELLRQAKLPYTMAAHPNDPRSIQTHAVPLRSALPRVMAALDGEFKDEQLLKSEDKFLVLADSRKSPRLSSSFPKDSEVQAVRTEGELVLVLGAVLGDRKLPPVSIKLGKLRQFVEYWEPMRTFTPGLGGGGGGSQALGPGEREITHRYAGYTGTVVYQLMAWFYEQVWRGIHANGSLSVLQGRLQAMWRNPLKYGVYVNKPLAKIISGANKSKERRQIHWGHLSYAQAYLNNYYIREFADYTAASRNVQQNMVGLATDRKSLITLEFASSSTGKLYKIYTRIPRVMKLDTAEGRTLTAYSYRTGKETPDDGEEFLARILAMALLRGHGRKGADGRWHHGSADGPVLSKLRVQLEYRSSHRTWTFDPDSFLQIEEGQVIQGPIAQEITSAIEREEADLEYQDYYREHEEEATKEDLKKKRAAPKGKAAAKGGAKPAKAPKAKPSRKTKGGK